MKTLETERLIIREMSVDDAAFILELLSTSKFIQYIGDRGVRTVAEAAAFIEDRYRQSYRDNGFGLYTVELKDKGAPIGICGFVKRGSLPHPDLGFAFLPRYEKQGYGFESATAVMHYGREVLGFKQVLAITTPENSRSGDLLEKIGFKFDRILDEPHDNETLKLYSIEI